VRAFVLPALGAGSRVLVIAGERLIIEPDARQTAGPLRTTATLLAIELVLAGAIAWLVASRLTLQAIRPLALVTSELQRFSRGDLHPRPIATRDRAELGELITAFNGAAAQVARALGERETVEANLRRFLADAGHELRTPLTVTSGYLEILRGGGDADRDTLERALATIDEQTRRMRSLVERLLALARLERSNRVDAVLFDVETGTRAAIETVVSARGGDVRFSTDGGGNVFADPIEFAEAVGNLVDNGIKYGAATQVTVAIASEGGDLVVRVTDGGPGIAQSERERVFERFYRGEAHGEIEGSGLGLAIVSRD